MQSKVAVCYRKNVAYPSMKDVFAENSAYIKEDGTLDCEIADMLKETFRLLELDRARFGAKDWNPLQNVRGGGWIRPGDTVLIKPNMVLDENQSRENGTDCLYTHPSLVAAVIPYVWKALEGRGRIIIADAPVQSCDLPRLLRESGYQDMERYYRKMGVNLEIRDLRGLVSHDENGILKAETLDNGGVLVDLKGESVHERLPTEAFAKMRITNYDPMELAKHHNCLKHEYLIASEVLDADVIINMPKPKSHRKAGVTIGMKNFVGANRRKEYLPHHRIGDEKHGGDEYKKSSLLLRLSSALLDRKNRDIAASHFERARAYGFLSRVLSVVDKKLISREQFREGSWYGNDTIWRTIVDLNRIIEYADKNGVMRDTPQRKIFTIADMIIVGEKEAPLMPSPVYGGVIAAGGRVACFDKAIATLMGFDIRKVPLFRGLEAGGRYPLLFEDEEAVIVSNFLPWNQKKTDDISKDVTMRIRPSDGWKGHIELD